jgi:hypothetical protein
MDTSSLTQARDLTSQAIKTPSSPAVRSAAWGQFSLWLRSRTRLLMALTVLAFALAAAWLWFGAEAARPLLYVLPCAAMMAVCMKGHRASGDTPSNTSTST